ncbi:MAG: hypothetical protein AB1529_02350 [Candidatus Micrarchaeota archaeon]
MDNLKLRRGSVDEKEGREDAKPKEKWGKWLLGSGAVTSVAAAAIIAISCGDSNTDHYIPIPPNGNVDGGTTEDGGPVTDGGDEDGGVTDGGDGGTCTPPTPSCATQTVNVLMNVGEQLVVGDYRIRLADTNEADGEQRAVIEVLDSCNQLIRSEPINEDGSKVFQVMGTDIEIEVSVTNVTITGAKSARVSAEMRCTTGTDGGPVTDGGPETDGGPTETDGGPADAGPDVDGGETDGGPVTDGGTEEDGGATDGGPTDGGPDVDGGPVEEDGGVSDGGPTDAGPDVDGGAAEDGGVTDAGPDVDGGADADAGVTDGGADADGGTVIVCSGLYNEHVDNGEFPRNEDVELGGYYFRYVSYTPNTATVEIYCSADSSLVSGGMTLTQGHEETLELPTDGKRIRFFLENKNTFRAIIDVNVEDLPP